MAVACFDTASVAFGVQLVSPHIELVFLSVAASYAYEPFMLEVGSVYDEMNDAKDLKVKLWAPRF